VAICWIERDSPMDEEHVQRKPWYRRAFPFVQRHEQTSPSLAASCSAQPLAEAMQVRWILIVEDEAGAASAIQQALEIEGSGQWKVQIARSGEEALAALERQPADLILLDVRLPGISGAEVHRRLRANPATRHLPIIFLSGATSFDLSVAGIQDGVLLRKPFQIPDLLAMVNANLPPPTDSPGAIASDAGL
jgi:CheY-like chemotaxis protein